MKLVTQSDDMIAETFKVFLFVLRSFSKKVGSDSVNIGTTRKILLKIILIIWILFHDSYTFRIMFNKPD